MDSSFEMAILSIVAGVVIFVGLIFLIYASLRLLDEPRSNVDQDID
jgi:hypothetical protein